jgi:hypothetical protein
MLTVTVSRASIAVMAAGMVCLPAAVGAPPDPLSALAPDGFLDAKRQADLSAGAAVVEVLPARGGDISIFGAAKIRVGTKGWPPGCGRSKICTSGRMCRLLFDFRILRACRISTGSFSKEAISMTSVAVSGTAAG